MPKKETEWEKIKRMGTKEYLYDITTEKMRSSLRREFNKTGQYYFKFNKGGYTSDYYKDIL